MGAVWGALFEVLLDGFDGTYDWSQSIVRPDPFEPAIDGLVARLPPADGCRPHARVVSLVKRIQALPPAGLTWLAEELHNLGGNPLVRERLVAQLPALVEPRLAVEGATLAADVAAVLAAVPEQTRLSQRRMLVALALLVGCDALAPMELPATFA